MSEKRDPFQKPKVQLVLNHPFFAVLSAHLPTVPVSAEFLIALGCPPTACVDGEFIYYNEEWVSAMPEAKRLGLLAHEVMHPALGHLWRRGSRNPETWRLAADYAINSILKKAGFELPDGGLFESRFDGMAVEQIYAILHQEQQEEEKKGGGKGKEGKGEKKKALDGQLEQSVSKMKEKKDKQDKGGAGDKKDEKKDDKKAQGESGKGEKKDDKDDKSKSKEQGEDPEEGDGADGDGDGGNGGSDSEEQHEGCSGKHDHNCGHLDDADSSEEQEEKWRSLLIQAAMVAKMRGNLPGDLARLVENLVEPKVPWQQVVEQYTNDVCRDDYDLMKQDRRFIEQGIYFPELQSNSTTIAVFVDTSGSIGQVELRAFASEIVGIMRCQGVKSVRIMACDTRVTLDVTLGPTDPIPDNFPGGGGTDFRPPFLKIRESQEELPALIVYLTDMCGTFPEEDPGIPTLWLASCPPYMKADSIPQPPFGTVIEYDPLTENVEEEVGSF